MTLAIWGQTGRGWWDTAYIQRQSDMILDLSRNHLTLAVLSVLLGFAIAFPLALIARRYPKVYGPLLQLTTIMYTIPSVAFFVLLLPFLGLSRANALAALTMYSLLVLLRNTVAGLQSVPGDVIDSAVGMGYTPLRLLLRVELPLALPVIFAGLRIAMVTAIGLAVIASIIGQPTLGRLFLNEAYRGGRGTAATVGLLIATGMSVSLDLLLLSIQRMLTPWSRRAA